ncbi:DUF6082 family protein [Streptomyces adustus]|uniref:DUF6082 family protein n=1 Tax=Streptomyces adustus TaxID=1609272 RepID=UPI0035D6CDA0
MSDEALTVLSAHFFQGAVGREYWTLFGAGWREGARARRSRRLLEILNRSFEAAVAAGPAVLTSDFFPPDQAN